MALRVSEIAASLAAKRSSIFDIRQKSSFVMFDAWKKALFSSISWHSFGNKATSLSLLYPLYVSPHNLSSGQALSVQKRMIYRRCLSELRISLSFISKKNPFLFRNQARYVQRQKLLLQLGARADQGPQGDVVPGQEHLQEALHGRSIAGWAGTDWNINVYIGTTLKERKSKELLD